MKEKMKEKRVSEMHEADIEGSLPLWHRMRQALRQRLARHSLPMNQAECLMYVHHLGEQAEPAILAEQMFLSRQTMTYILDQLERQKLVCRTPHPVDRRRKIITLTPEGAKLAATIMHDLLTYEKAAAARVLTPEQKREIRAIVIKLAEVLEELNETT